MSTTMKINLREVRKSVRKRTPSHLAVGRVHRKKNAYARTDSRRAERDWTRG
jgi:hypothetical protein